jgi:hypothetical protein
MPSATVLIAFVNKDGAPRKLLAGPDVHPKTRFEFNDYRQPVITPPVR